MKCMSHNRLTDLPLTHFPYCQVNPGLQVWPPEVAAVQLSSWIPAQGNLLNIFLLFLEACKIYSGVFLEVCRILPGAFWKPVGSYLEPSGSKQDLTWSLLEAWRISQGVFWRLERSYLELFDGQQDYNWNF